jgi:VanZ family protein
MFTLTNLFRLLALLWVGLLYYLSAQPSLDVPLLFPGQDKVLHLLVYAVLGFLILGGMRPAEAGYRRGNRLAAFLLVVLYGILDEYHQSFVPGRIADPLDVLADAVGGLIGVGLMALIYRKQNQG